MILQDRGVIRLSISQMIGIPFSENARHTESRTAFQLLAFAKDRLWADLGGFAQVPRRWRGGPHDLLYRRCPGHPNAVATSGEDESVIPSFRLRGAVVSSCRVRVTYRMFYAVATSGESESRSFTCLSSGPRLLGASDWSQPLPAHDLNRRTSITAVELQPPDHPRLDLVLASSLSYGVPTYGRLSVDASCQRYSAPLAGLGTSPHSHPFLWMASAFGRAELIIANQSRPAMHGIKSSWKLSPPYQTWLGYLGPPSWPKFSSSSSPCSYLSSVRLRCSPNLGV